MSLHYTIKRMSYTSSKPKQGFIFCIPFQGPEPGQASAKFTSSYAAGRTSFSQIFFRWLPKAYENTWDDHFNVAQPCAQGAYAESYREPLPGRRGQEGRVGGARTLTVGRKVEHHGNRWRGPRGSFASAPETQSDPPTTSGTTASGLQEVTISLCLP